MNNNAYGKIVLRVILLFIWLTAGAIADSVSGTFTTEGRSWRPSHQMLVHEEDEKRIRVHLTDFNLNEEQKKYLAGNRGNNFSENTIQIYIPVKVSPAGIVKFTGEKVKCWSFVKPGGYWTIPSDQVACHGTLNNLKVTVRGEKRYRKKTAVYSLRVNGKTYSMAERSRKEYPRLNFGEKEVGVEASWGRRKGKIYPEISVYIHEGRNSSGQGFTHLSDTKKLTAALKSGKSFKYHGLSLKPRGNKLALKTHGALGSGPREVLLSRAQAKRIASDIEKAARHVKLKG